MSVSKDELYELYIVQQMPMHKVADEMNIAVGTVYNYLKKYCIPTREAHKGMKGKTFSNETRMKLSKILSGKKRTLETRKKISESHKLSGSGHKKQRTDGYISIYFPTHPQSNKSGYVMEHVLIMENKIGRYLNPDECVHHKNFLRNDNRIENLELMTKSEHMSFHSKKRWEEKRKVE